MSFLNHNIPVWKAKVRLEYLYNKIPAPFNKGLKPNMDITKLLEYFERMK